MRRNTLIRRAGDRLQAILPPGWKADVAPAERGEAALTVRPPKGRPVGEVRVRVQDRLEPRGVASLVREEQEALRNGAAVLAVAPWLSRATRDRLAAEGISALDLTGNARIVLTDPGLFVCVDGAERDPSPAAVRVTLKGESAARVVRRLVEVDPPVGVRELADRARVTPGYVSKLLSMLDEQDAVERVDGKVVEVKRPRLFELWADDSPIRSRTRTTSWLDPRGLKALLTKLPSFDGRYAVTGSLAAVRYAPVAESRLASIYVEDAESAAEALGLRAADAGANVLLLESEDDGVFDGADPDTANGVTYASIAQVAVDLLTGTGRSPAEGAALVAWMDGEDPEGG